MIGHEPDLPERIGRAINQLDIDFSNFTLAGWGVSVASLAAGSAAAYGVCYAMIRRNGVNLAAGMVFCFTVIAVTTVTFLILRSLLRRMGVAIVKSQGPADP